jgi:CRISPR-associated protein Csb2
MRLLVIPPHLLERRAPMASERRHMELLDAALDGFDDLRAGPAGQLRLAPGSVDLEQDPLFGSGRVWESATDYQPTRHAKKTTPEAALLEDLIAEMQRRHMPAPQVEVLAAEQGPRGGLKGRLRLRFAEEQRGPLLIGRSRHRGGGVFKRTE